MPTVYRYSLCAVLMIGLLACSCSTAKDVGKTWGELAKVRAELIKKFGEEGLDLRINTFENRSNISVLYVNTPLNLRTTEERGKRAQETAQIVMQHYPAIKNVGEIWVGFMRVTTRLVVFRRSEMLEAYGFDNAGRTLGDPGTAPLDPTQPEVRYSANQNKTDISSSAIQLEGTTEKGVAFVAHFSVAGDVNKITTKPPKEIALDFAAFSEKPKFSNLTKIVFLSDDKIVYETEGQFSTSKIPGGMYSEFLYLTVPRAAFLKISSGRSLKIKLDENEYTLTDNQVLQFQRMSDYLK